MGLKNWTCSDIEIEENKFYRHEIPIFLKDENIEKVLVSKTIFSGEKNYKYFIGYFYDDHKVKPVNIMLRKQALM